MSLISVKNLSKIYEYHKKQPGLLGSFKTLFKREKLFTEAVKSLSFSIEEGELVGLLGPNGAGKTTTLKILAGILYPSGGEAKVMNYTPWRRQPEYQKKFAIVMGQKNQLWWDLPAMESFILNKEIYEISDAQFKETIINLSELLDIKDILDIQVRKLSLGQRMKCELVAALLHNPQVLFLDEPTIGLDIISQQKMRDFIKRYNKEKKTTIILTSHYMQDVEELCQRVIIINKGVNIYDGKLKDLVNKYINYKILTVTFSENITPDKLSHFGSIKEFNSKRAVLKIKNNQVKENASKILATLPVEDILIGNVEIETIIRHIFEEKIK